MPGSYVRELMTREPVTLKATAMLRDAVELVMVRRVRHIPVTDPSDQLLGIVSIGDVVKSRLGELEGERQALLEYITKG